MRRLRPERVRVLMLYAALILTVWALARRAPDPNAAVQHELRQVHEVRR